MRVCAFQINFNGRISAKQALLRANLLKAMAPKTVLHQLKCSETDSDILAGIIFFMLRRQTRAEVIDDGPFRIKPEWFWKATTDL